MPFYEVQIYMAEDTCTVYLSELIEDGCAYLADPRIYLSRRHSSLLQYVSTSGPERANLSPSKSFF